MTDFRRTPNTQVKRLPKRGAYEHEVVYRILDEAFVCHVGFVVEGQPYVIPTNYGRDRDTLYVHGSVASRMLRTLSAGVPVCVTVTLVDGLVLARSAFHHSVNYRSVVMLGRASLVNGAREKIEALRLFTEHIMKGRWADVRQPNPQELKATAVRLCHSKRCQPRCGAAGRLMKRRIILLTCGPACCLSAWCTTRSSPTRD